MQAGATHASANSGPEICPDADAVTHKPNTAKRKRILRSNSDLKLFERGQAIRQHSFPTCLVDGWNGDVRNGYPEPTLPCGYSRCKPSRPASDHQNVFSGRAVHDTLSVTI
jgi:hypothetical protein